MAVVALQRLQDPNYTGTANTASEYVRESLVDPEIYVVEDYLLSPHRMPAYTYLSEEDIAALVEMLLQQRWLEAAGPDRLPNIGAVVKIADGAVTEVANTWEIEGDTNPRGFVLDTHPHGFAAGPDGWLWVADAGANNLLRVDPISGAVELIAVFDGLPGPFPNTMREDALEIAPVPTAAVVDADGNAYVSLLSGFPFVPGSAKVVKVAADGAVSDYATGLTMLTDLRRGPDDATYALRFAIFGEKGPTPNSGALLRIGEGDDSEILIDGPSFPTSLDFNADGDVYITINGIGAPGSSAVIKLAGATAMVGQLLPE